MCICGVGRVAGGGMLVPVREGSARLPPHHPPPTAPCVHIDTIIQQLRNSAMPASNCAPAISDPSPGARHRRCPQQAARTAWGRRSTRAGGSGCTACRSAAAGSRSRTRSRLPPHGSGTRTAWHKRPSGPAHAGPLCTWAPAHTHGRPDEPHTRTGAPRQGVERTSGAAWAPGGSGQGLRRRPCVRPSPAPWAQVG